MPLTCPLETGAFPGKHPPSGKPFRSASSNAAPVSPSTLFFLFSLERENKILKDFKDLQVQDSDKILAWSQAKPREYSGWSAPDCTVHRPNPSLNRGKPPPVPRLRGWSRTVLPTRMTAPYGQLEKRPASKAPAREFFLLL